MVLSLAKTLLFISTFLNSELCKYGIQIHLEALWLLLVAPVVFSAWPCILPKWLDSHCKFGLNLPWPLVLVKFVLTGAAVVGRGGSTCTCWRGGADGVEGLSCCTQREGRGWILDFDADILPGDWVALFSFVCFGIAAVHFVSKYLR